MISQLVQDGKLVGATTAATNSQAGAKVKSSMNETKEMFLQLLVAEMQYQDPLEPTDNSEYVKELATFTQVETLNNVQEDISKLSSQALVGKYVSLNDEDTGLTVEGKVDYVTENAGEQYISVDDKLYKASAVTAVHDDDYFESVTMADTFASLVNQMPSEKELTIADEEKLGILNTVYNGMTESQRKFVSEEVMDKFTKVNERMTELVAQKETYSSEDTAQSVSQASAAKDTDEDDGGSSEDTSSQTASQDNNASGGGSSAQNEDIPTTTA